MSAIVICYCGSYWYLNSLLFYHREENPVVLRNESYYIAHKLFLSVAQVCHRFFNLLVNKLQGVEVVEVGQFKYLGSTIIKKNRCAQER